ncbi:hypothetical protein [Dactylosporangium sp. NPDC049140]|uniref:hypothetical protein n=1 Tax=Dactylosporangium sp. NPDC049140 TaxID=3155647 RepID=UPI0033CC6AA6
MLITELALVADTPNVTGSQLNRVAAALQKQAIRDFAPIWDIVATIDGFERLEDVPIGYWPIIVRDDIDAPGAAGVHLDRNGQPFALVQVGDSWSLTASHEMLEMLVDPFGNRLVAGQSPKPDQGRVEFLVEVADPSEDAQFGYTVNGLLVSDFFTPQFYDPVAAGGVRYTFGGHLTGPRRIAKGGYLSWHDPISDHWWQQIWFDTDEPQFRDLGRLTDRAGSLRSAIDARTQTALRMAREGAGSAQLTSARELTAQIKTTTGSRAGDLRRQIQDIRDAGATEGVWVDVP